MKIGKSHILPQIVCDHPIIISQLPLDIHTPVFGFIVYFWPIFFCLFVKAQKFFRKQSGSGISDGQSETEVKSAVK